MRWWVNVGLAASISLFLDGPLQASQTMSFVPGDRSPILPASFHPRRSGSRFHRRAFQARGRGAPGRNQADDEPSAAAPPGSGFKMEDGVLTYPAPARFQPKNLKHL